MPMYDGRAQLWNMFVRKMPGLKPYYAMRDKTSFLRSAPKLVNKNAKVAKTIACHVLQSSITWSARGI